MATAAAQTCTDHCRLCGQHFHGIGAYDLHRVGDVAIREGPGRRRCVQGGEVRNGRGQAALRIWTTTGVCTLGATPREEGVTIWQDAAGAERMDDLRRKGVFQLRLNAERLGIGRVGAGHAARVFHSATGARTAR
jgi:hypothetical protein